MEINEDLQCLENGPTKSPPSFLPKREEVKLAKENLIEPLENDAIMLESDIDPKPGSSL